MLITFNSLESIADNCMPGNQWRHGCVDCWCNSMEATECTDIRCVNPERFQYKTITNEKYREPNFNCEPHEHFKIDCNFCTCWMDRKSLICSDKKCAVESFDEIPIKKLKYEIEREKRRKNFPNFYNFWPRDESHKMGTYGGK